MGTWHNTLFRQWRRARRFHRPRLSGRSHARSSRMATLATAPSWLQKMSSSWRRRVFLGSAGTRILAQERSGGFLGGSSFQASLFSIAGSAVADQGGDRRAGPAQRECCQRREKAQHGSCRVDGEVSSHDAFCTGAQCLMAITISTP